MWATQDLLGSFSMWGSSDVCMWGSRCGVVVGEFEVVCVSGRQGVVVGSLRGNARQRGPVEMLICPSL